MFNAHHLLTGSIYSARSSCWFVSSLPLSLSSPGRALPSPHASLACPCPCPSPFQVVGNAAASTHPVTTFHSFPGPADASPFEQPAPGIPFPVCWAGLGSICSDLHLSCTFVPPDLFLDLHTDWHWTLALHTSNAACAVRPRPCSRRFPMGWDNGACSRTTFYGLALPFTSPLPSFHFSCASLLSPSPAGPAVI